MTHLAVFHLASLENWGFNLLCTWALLLVFVTASADPCHARNLGPSKSIAGAVGPIHASLVCCVWRLPVGKLDTGIRCGNVGSKMYEKLLGLSMICPQRCLLYWWRGRKPTASSIFLIRTIHSILASSWYPATLRNVHPALHMASLATRAFFLYRPKLDGGWWMLGTEIHFLQAMTAMHKFDDVWLCWTTKNTLCEIFSMVWWYQISCQSLVLLSQSWSTPDSFRSTAILQELPVTVAFLFSFFWLPGIQRKGWDVENLIPMEVVGPKTACNQGSLGHKNIMQHLGFVQQSLGFASGGVHRKKTHDPPDFFGPES